MKHGDIVKVYKHAHIVSPRTTVRVAIGNSLFPLNVAHGVYINFDTYIDSRRWGDEL